LKFADKSGIQFLTLIEWKGGDTQIEISAYIPISELQQIILRRRMFQ